MNPFVDAVAAAPRRTLKGRFWHQGSPSRDLLAFADPAVGPGRFHAVGGPGAWYASNAEQAAWAELFRHFVNSGVSPFEVRRRVGSVIVVDLDVLDLTSAKVRAAVGVQVDELTGDDYQRTQQIAAAAWAAGFDAILSPSAALPGYVTLAMCSTGLGKVTVTGGSAVRLAPPRMAGLIERIPFHAEVPAALRRVVRRTGRGGRQAIVRRRHDR